MMLFYEDEGVSEAQVAEKGGVYSTSRWANDLEGREGTRYSISIWPVPSIRTMVIMLHK